MVLLSNSALDSLLANQQVIVILRNQGIKKTLEVAHLAWEIGILAVEVTLQTDEDRDTLAAVSRAAGGLPGLLVGAGTITHQDDVDFAADSGAHFTVSPGLDLDIVERSWSLGMPSIPGVATPTEVHRALSSGLTWLKAFPAAQLGPGWIKNVLAPFPKAKFIATGGVTPALAVEVMKAGGKMVGVGVKTSGDVAREELQRLANSLKQFQADL
jgi:Entner-Doudoroff aldolase